MVLSPFFPEGERLGERYSTLSTGAFSMAGEKETGRFAFPMYLKV